MIHSGFGLDGAQRSSETRAARPGVPQRDGIKDSRVLLVEDEPLISMELSDVLEDAGARVVKIAASLDEAIVAARTLDFDFALLDGNLRGAPVDVVAHTLRLRGVPFCFISGYSRDQLPRDFQDAPLLTKPVDQDKLLEVVLKLQTGENRRATG